MLRDPDGHVAAEEARVGLRAMRYETKVPLDPLKHEPQAMEVYAEEAVTLEKLIGAMQ
jgi:hypothetical protein